MGDLRQHQPPKESDEMMYSIAIHDDGTATVLHSDDHGETWRSVCLCDIEWAHTIVDALNIQREFR
jgi:hypothetical protein